VQLEEFAAEKLLLPVSDRPLAVEARKGLVRIDGGAAVYGRPDSQAAALFRVAKGGTVVPELARVDGMVKVELEKGRFAFVRGQDAREVKTAKPAAPKDFLSVPFREPPQISVNVEPEKGGVVASGDRFTLTGTVSDPLGILDMYVLVNDQKVFFRTVEPKAPDTTRVKFSTDFPLKEGANYVLVVARQTPDYGARRALVIRRRPAAVAQALSHADGAVGGWTRPEGTPPPPPPDARAAGKP